MRTRVVFLSRPYPRYPGDPYGAEVLYLAEAMAAQGQEIVLITTTQSPVRSRQVKVHAFPLPKVKVVSFILSFIWAFFLTLGYAWFGRMRVLSLQWAYPLGPIGLVVRWLAPVCLITTARGSDLSAYGTQGRWRGVISRILRASEGVIAVGSGLRRIALDLGTNPERCAVIPSVGVDVRKFSQAKPAALSGKGLKLLYVGGLVQVKGLDILLEACARLKTSGQDFQLILVGKGPQDDMLHQLAQTLGLEDQLTFVGEIPHPEIPSYYTAADIFVLPSRQEGLGIVLLEALAAGKVVVASRVGGIPDIIRNGENGLLVEPENPEALAAALKRVLEDPGLRSTLTAGGKKSLDRYTYEYAATETSQFLRKCCQGIGNGDGDE